MRHAVGVASMSFSHDERRACAISPDPGLARKSTQTSSKSLQAAFFKYGEARCARLMRPTCAQGTRKRET